MQRTEAWRLLQEWTKKPALIAHARSVEISMRALARHLAADEESWGIAGLLHDADYDQWPDEHPKRIVAWLAERGEAEIAHAVSAHYTHWGVSYDTTMDKALLAADELTGFIGAAARVRPDGLAGLEVKSVLKRLKDLRFAAGVDRGEVAAGAKLLEMDVADLVELLLAAQRPFADEWTALGRGEGSDALGSI